ncbi:dicarboxylate/amino acid:cation symporter [Exilibacterium tricleocarpae]|uniref:Dicarboxylate/amino acid:cation symporter n=1 Tax=Exilibacterium tricleocarpae TaxID=2591008 RepID=A0A545U704_9GAMM|nr:dicarboxylate/amino acid:cation symporter [Exilibacterium tricleocarpae]TQV85173.1 dicarboxylate/amino acid:cation symporter [Exilibacterium tricleocarpae]
MQKSTLSNPLIELTDQLQRLIRGKLWLQVLIGLAAGIITGVVLGPDIGWIPPDTAAVIGSWLALPGSLFLTLVQMIIVPLVFASIILGLASSSSMGQLKVLGTAGSLYFLITTVLATTLGLLLALAIKPGDYINPELVRATVGAVSAAPTGQLPKVPGILDLPGAVSALLPTNPLAAMVKGEMLQVILFAVVFGIALLNVAAKKSAPLFDLLGALQEVCIKIVSGAMRLAPIAVFGLMARLTSTVGGQVIFGLSMYVLVVLVGLGLLLAMHGIIAMLVAQCGLRDYVTKIRDVALLAFSTSSSAAVMPLTLQIVQERFAVRPAVAQLIVPLGATINVNGTALYQGIAAVFLAQVFDVQLGTAGLVFIVSMAVAASIGSPATPGAGIVILAMVLEGVGIPAAGIGLLIGVDRILDMSRTSANVVGDVTACLVVDRLTPAVEKSAQPMGDAGANTS